MSESIDQVLKAAVLEWQKKYNVQDGDPLLASLELFQIYFASWQLRGQGSGGASSSSYEEFRDSFEALEHRTRALTKQTVELIEALRSVPNIKQHLRAYHATTQIMIAALALGIGIFLGRFLS